MSKVLTVVRSERVGLWEGHPGRGNSTCEVPEVGGCLDSWRDRRGSESLWRSKQEREREEVRFEIWVQGPSHSREPMDTVASPLDERGGERRRRGGDLTNLRRGPLWLWGEEKTEGNRTTRRRAGKLLPGSQPEVRGRGQGRQAGEEGQVPGLFEGGRADTRVWKPRCCFR